INTARAALGRIRVSDRTRLDESSLERLRGRNVRYRCALPDRDSDANAPKIGAAPRHKLPGFFKFSHQRSRHDDQVRMLTSRDDVAQLTRRPDREIKSL